MQPPPPCNDPAGCTDPYDTHVSGDVTFHSLSIVTFASPVYDAATDQYETSWTETAPDIHVHVDAGYTNTGQVKFTTQWTDGADPTALEAPQVVLADLTANTTSLFNNSNAELTYSTEPAVDAASPMGMLGSTTNGDVTAGIIVYMDDTTSFNGSRSTAQGRLDDRLPSGAEPLSVAIRRAADGTRQLTALQGRPVSLRMLDANRFEATDVPPGTTGALLSRGVADGNGGVPNGPARHSRIFAHVGNGKQWILDEDHVTVDDESPGRKLHNETVMKFAHVKWFLNAAQDSARHAARPTTEGIPLPPESSSGADTRLSGSETVASLNLRPGSVSMPRRLAPGTGRNGYMYCGDECTDSIPGVDWIAPDQVVPIGQEPPCGLNEVTQVNDTGVVVNLAYVHGLHSDATTWCDMAPYIASRMVVGNEIRHTTQPADYYQNQAASLEAMLDTDVVTHPGPYVFIGHSNGGIVARWIAQDYAARGNNSIVRAVVTVATPHAGAPLANITQEQLQYLLSLDDLSPFACNIVETLVCGDIQALASTEANGLLSFLTSYTRDDFGPVLSQMTPHNAFQSQINARGDGPYAHFAVTQKSWDKWTEWKLLGDLRACSTYTPNCGDHGHHEAQDVDRDYHRFIDCSVVGGFLAIFWQPSIYASVACASAAGALKAIDLNYKRISVGNDSGDGIVPLASQAYPGSASFEMDDADSHLGETHSQSRTGHFIVEHLSAELFIPLVP